MPDDDPTIVYTVKELLGNIQKTVDEGFAGVRASLETKADKSQIDAITRRLDEHGREIGALKDRQREDEAAASALSGARASRLSGRQWAVGILFTAAIALSAWLPYLTR